MRTRRPIAIFSIVFLLIGLITACGTSSNRQSDDSLAKSLVLPSALYQNTASPLSEAEQALYDSTVGILLTQDLWTSRDTYDTAHYLMVPMHYAFQSGNTRYIEAFANFFTRFTADVTDEDIYGFQENGLLNIMQFYYFISQFISLCARYGYESFVPVDVIPLITEKMETFYYKTPGNWGCEPTRQEHFQQVLAGKEYPYSYYRCVEDFDWFFLGCMCDLNFYHCVIGEEPSELEQVAADLAYELLSSPLVIEETENGGFLFQPGAWRDHPDMAYAGRESITPGMKPKPREDIVEDSSHFTRWGALIISWRDAQPTQERYELLETRREQLATQVSKIVCHKVDGYWLTTTFMDGTNGVFRYSYHEEDIGYEGYDLSGTMLLGWWSLLGDSRIQRIYEETLTVFPLSRDPERNPYFDPVTVREQNPFFDADTAYDNGMMECMVLCAARLHY